MEQPFYSLPVAILCGGMGTRLGSLTRHKPKSSIFIHGKPFLWWQLRMLQGRGFKKFVLCAGHLSYMLEGWREYPVVVCAEEKPLGTGGAVKNARPYLGSEFFVTYGDAYLDQDYTELYKSHLDSGKVATMSTWNGLDYGMNILCHSAFEGFSGAFDIHAVFDDLKAKGQLNTWKSPQRFYEIGSLSGLAEVTNLLA